MRPLEVRPVAGAPPFISGVAVIRGVPAPVVDAASLFGGIGEPRSEEVTRFVTLKTADRRVALEVQQILGVTQVDPARLADLPPLLADAAEHIAAIGTLDRDLLVVLRAGRFVPDEAWAAIDAGARR